MGGWSCDACTVRNVEDNARKCQICETLRSEAADLVRSCKGPANVSLCGGAIIGRKRPSEPQKMSTVQATLFGGVAAKSVVQPNLKKPKTAEISKQSTLSFAAKQRPKTTSEDGGSGLVVWKECAGQDVPFSELKNRARIAMKTIFGVEKLRLLQPKAVGCALKRESQLVVMATGGGKSLCYQLPAVVLGGTSIVISPLIALMQDQVQALNDKGVAAALISSGNGDRHNREIMERLLGRSLAARPQKVKPADQKPFDHITILYVTPEQVQTTRFRDILVELHKKNSLSLFAVDEAHCLSSWGHDFRKAYMRLDYLRDTFPNVPLIACTATATAKVIDDIRKTLYLEKSPCHIGSFDRPNIFYKVKYKDSLDSTCVGGAAGDLVRFIQKQHQRCAEKNVECSGIVYCHTRAETAELASTIRKATQIGTEAYHGGLKVDDRNRIQQAWTSGASQIAVATVAFGMGIDLPHVRYVVHWNLAKTPEAFYQESGRAGRDGLPAFSMLYYSKNDASKFQFLLSQRQSEKGEKGRAREMDALKEMVNYCIVPGCRRYKLLRHFGEKMGGDPKQVCDSSCDYCLNPTRVEQAIEAANSVNDFAFHTRKPHASRPVEEDDTDSVLQDLDASWNVGGLAITGRGVATMNDDDLHSINETSIKKPLSNFVKASMILSKYEAIECKGASFVNFKEKKDSEIKTDDRIRIPKHLIPTKHPASSSSKSNKSGSVVEEKKSADFAEEADQLREELARAKAEREARQMLTMNRSGNRQTPPPPPTLLFTVKRKR